MSAENTHKRPIRSFVKRAGRMTPAQKRFYQAYRKQRDKNELNLFKPLPAKPIVIEIGFGMGQSLLMQAAEHPEHVYIGIEVHPPGIGQCLMGIDKQQLKNLHLIEGDAQEIFAHHVQDNSIDVVQIFFPDPWPKKRHHKRRLIQQAFLDLLHQKLKSGGRLHIATDWANYAEEILALLKNNPCWKNVYATDFAPNTAGRPPTKFEARGERLGHKTFDLVFCQASGQTALMQKRVRPCRDDNSRVKATPVT